MYDLYESLNISRTKYNKKKRYLPRAIILYSMSQIKNHTLIHLIIFYYILYSCKIYEI